MFRRCALVQKAHKHHFVERELYLNRPFQAYRLRSPSSLREPTIPVLISSSHNFAITFWGSLTIMSPPPLKSFPGHSPSTPLANFIQNNSRSEHPRWSQ